MDFFFRFRVADGFPTAHNLTAASAILKFRPRRDKGLSSAEFYG